MDKPTITKTAHGQCSGQTPYRSARPEPTDGLLTNLRPDAVQQRSGRRGVDPTVKKYSRKKKISGKLGTFSKTVRSPRTSPAQP